MTVEIEDRAGVKVVHVQGELVGGQGTLADAVVNLLDGPGVGLVIDLADVPVTYQVDASTDNDPGAHVALIILTELQ